MGFISVFNDVLGLIMRGRSSSHTAGAYRIDRLAVSLHGGRPSVVRCTFHPDGSFAATYQPLGADLAFAAGLLGWEMTDERYGNALKATWEAGINLSFGIEPFEAADHPNTIRIEMSSKGGGSVRMLAKSVGGGGVNICRLDGWEVDITGKAWDMLIQVDGRKLPSERLEMLIRETTAAPAGTLSLCDRMETEGARDDGAVLYQYSANAAVTAQTLRVLSQIRGVKQVRTAEPIVLPLVRRVLFSSAEEMVRLADTSGFSLGRIACRYEAELLGMNEREVIAEMLSRYEIMEQSVERGLEEGNVDMPLLQSSASSILARQREGRLPYGGLLTTAAIRAMACMHVCNSRGIVCAAPTGGSAGVVPAVVMTTVEEKGLNKEQAAMMLFAASAVGLVVANRATFAAEIAGCQVEIGVTGAMAAAAVVQAAGGSADMAMNAAAVSLQNTMGSVCDPVQGGCEIPCYTRNAAAAANVFLCADLVMGRYGNPIPLDETVDASFQVGKMLPRELRCTTLGGIAATPSARSISKP